MGLKNKLFANNLRFGKEVKKISQIKEKLLINFKDNTNDLVDFIVVSDGVFSNTKSIVENKSIQPVYNGSIAIRTILKNLPESNYDKNSISLIMLKNAHIVIYPINKKGELNVVCIVRQKLSNNIDLKALIKKEIIGEIIGFDRIQDSKACEFVSSITGDNKREVVSFGTEAGLFQEIGISTVVCGPGSIEQAHTIDEFIELNEIKKCLSFLEGVKERSVIN